MPVVFKEPLFLISLILVPIVGFWMSRHRFPGLPSRRKAVAITLRYLILVLVILALAGTSMRKPAQETSVIFAMDQSDSITSAGKNKSFDFVKQALAHMSSKNTAGIVVFGAESLIERYPSNDNTLGYLGSTPKTELTNIADALHLSTIMFPEDSKKHLVLLSDGNESLGNTGEVLDLLKLGNVRLSTVELPTLDKNEVIVTSLRAPSYVRKGESFSADVKVESDVKTRGQLQLLQDDIPISSTVVAIEKGLNEFSFDMEAESTGFKRIKVLLEPEIDQWPENNEAHAITVVEGPPSVLIVEGVAGEAESLTEVLKNSSLKATVIKPDEMPAKTAGLADYQVAILVNVSAEQMGEERMTALKSFVRDMGGGLVAVGGSQSFGIGGYSDTPLEEALPVKADIEGRRRLPSVAVVLVIDKSGSMGACHCSGENRETAQSFEGGISKVELSKVAVVQASKVLGKKDYFGVVAVDDAARWVVPLKKYADKGKVEDLVGSISADGGQVLEAGLDEAVKSLKKNKAQIKHVIMLTDGWTGMDGLRPIIEKMGRNGITFSSVAAGGGSSDLLQELADVGSGRYYPLTSDWDIPKFITKETALVSRPYINEHLFHPKLASLSPIVKSLGDTGIPPLKGYVTTTPKSRAEVIFISDEDDPVLATWQYGLGTAVAWLSDAKNQWSSEWVQWERYDEFWSSLIRSCMPQKRDSDIIANVQDAGKDALLSVSFKAGSKLQKTAAGITAQVANPDGSSSTVRLEELSQGTFEARFEASQQGVYLITVSVKKRDGSVSSQMLGHAVPYPSEYRFREPNKALLTRLVAATGGSFLTSPAEAFSTKLPPHYSLRDISEYLLLLAFVLFFFDIALRRITLSREDVHAAYAYIGALRGRLASFVGAKKTDIEEDATISRLEEAKKRASKRWEE